MTSQHSIDAQPRGWHSRCYLPHFDGGEVAQMVTIRLADSVPASTVEKWQDTLAILESEEAQRKYRLMIEAYLDRGIGACWLKEHIIAEMVEEALFFFDGKRYRLQAWVIMPNHLHCLLTPLAGFSLSHIMFSLKSYTAKAANRHLGRTGKFWFEDYFDRFIRNEEHYNRAIAYIEDNPVKAYLCPARGKWPWSSARFRQ